MTTTPYDISLYGRIQRKFKEKYLQYSFSAEKDEI